MALVLPLQFLVVLLAGWLNRQQQEVIDYLMAENGVLRELHGRRRFRLTDGQRLRLARAGKALGRARLVEVAAIATPDTILRWFRTLAAQKYVARARRRPVRRVRLADLVVRIATENPRFGYTRIRDALANLGRRVGRSTVARILAERGIEPAPERRRRTSWREFLAAHWDGLFGADFFTVEVLTWSGIVRYHVLFFMELKSRRVHIAGLTCDPNEAWMLQIARNLTDAVDGVLSGARHLILDRDPLFSDAFRRLLEAQGIEILRLPARSPNLNAYCERWVRSIREECLDRIVPLGERHLRRAISEYVTHYHRERNHQGLEGRLIEPEPGVGSREGRVLCRRRLGGLLNYYHRAVA